MLISFKKLSKILKLSIYIKFFFLKYSWGTKLYKLQVHRSKYVKCIIL